ncbi:hypothetical protein [Sporolactobacillus pectinivorans]|uniref:hypothetical protein n=1 Tax=Sporolactobacillus pectinivorans TaxID=1591408 RepID=UPI000C25A736|nr:hypothetical protein [Sporolactobacillus pectinivorans]
MNKLGTLLKSHELSKALQYAKNLRASNLYNDLVEFIYADKKNLAWVSLMTQLFANGETASLHHILHCIFSFDLNDFDGAPNLALYHARKAVELSDEKDPEYVDYLADLLHLSIEPDELVSREEGKMLAKKILDLDPDNEFVNDEMKNGNFI